MLIRELAQRTGISTKTIRYYETVGLLPPPQRATNRYRLYTERDVARLRFIAGARSLDYSLADIARLLAIQENGSQACQGVLAALDARLSELERQITDLQAMHTTLKQIRWTAVEHSSPHQCDTQCAGYQLIASFRNEERQETE